MPVMDGVLPLSLGDPLQMLWVDPWDVFEGFFRTPRAQFMQEALSGSLGRPRTERVQDHDLAALERACIPTEPYRL